MTAWRQSVFSLCIQLSMRARVQTESSSMPSTSSPSSGLFNYRLAQQMITKQSTLLDELAILYCIEQHCVLMMQEKPTI